MVLSSLDKSSNAMRLNITWENVIPSVIMIDDILFLKSFAIY